MTEAHLEQALQQALDRHLGADQTPPNLAESIRYSLLAPGKRIRPRLALACARMIGLSPQAALPAALAIEMIHCFTLIHDDLPCMDDDDFRRGRPSNHIVHGEALALLAGDALMMLAVDTLCEALPHVRPECFAHALKRLTWASGPRGVIGGQAAESLLGSSSTLGQLERMHAMKTGALFSASLLLPMDLAGVSDSSTPGNALEAFAASLGLAFQVADDLDDGDQEVGSPTSILAYLPASRARQQTLEKLREASAQLCEAWGELPAHELSTIANEVGKNLEKNAGENPS